LAVRPDSVRKKHRLVVRRERPHRLYLLLAAGVVLMALVAVYLIGERRAGFLRFRSEAKIAHVDHALSQTSAENEKLRLRVSFLEHALSLSHQSAGALKNTLSQQQTRLAELRRNLDFYRGILTAGNGSASIRIGGLQVLPTGRRHEYRFQIVLVRADGKSSPALSGTCGVTVTGERGGKTVALPLRRVSPSADDPLKFRLRYFTNLAGTLDLPAGFKPRSVKVNVDIKGDGTVKGRYNWPAFRG